MTTSSDTTPLDIAVLVGSLRKQSFSRKVALALQELAPPEQPEPRTFTPMVA